MKLIFATAAALVVLSTAASAVAQTSAPAAQPPAQPPALNVRPSGKAMKAIVDLQDAVNKKDFASVPAKVAAARAVASTKEDRYLIGALQLRAAASANDTAGFAAALDALAESGLVPQKTLASFYGNLAGTYFKNNQFAQSTAAYQKSLALDPSNSDTMLFLAEAQSAAGQKAEAAATFQRALQSQTASGQRPSEDLMRRAVGTAYDAKLPAAVDLAREWVAAYPSASSWSNALAIYSNMNQTDAEARLDIARLLQAAGALSNPLVYEQYVIAALDLKNYNEAQAALDAGVAAKLINPNDADFREIAAAVRERPKATAADLAAATKAAVNGMALLRIGDRYYAMGDYAKAVEVYRMSIGKPDVDPGLANLHIGMALARAGDKAGATAALKAVTGPRADLAKYWLLYVGQKA